MAGQLTSFLSGSNVIVKIGDNTLAYCQDLRFSRNVGHVPVRGIGSYGTLALEPVDFAVNGSFVITRWDNISEDKNKDLAPDSIAHQTSLSADGNSMFNIDQGRGFSPFHMLLSATFDIYIYKKPTPTGKYDGTNVPPVTAGGANDLLLTLKDCRMTGYSFSFFPGQILNENATFMARTVIDATLEG